MWARLTLRTFKCGSVATRAASVSLGTQSWTEVQADRSLSHVTQSTNGRRRRLDPRAASITRAPHKYGRIRTATYRQVLSSGRDRDTGSLARRTNALSVRSISANIRYAGNRP